MNPKALISFFILYSSAIVAQFSTYTYKRKLNPVEKEGYYSIILLPEITASCRSNLYDIRLYSIKKNDTSEIAYFMEWMGTKNEQTAIPFQLINTTHTEKCCSYVTLKFGTRHPINQIVLTIPDANFDKRVKVEGSNDNQQWFTICDHERIVRFNDVNEHFEHTSLHFQNAEYTYFRLKFDDDETPKILVTGANAFENKTTYGNYDELKTNPWKQVENKKEKASELILDMPFQYMVNRILLKSDIKFDFYRNVNVYGSAGVYPTPEGNKENWYLINTSVFSSTDSCSIECNNEAVKKLKIEIINYDNQPIAISEIKAYGEQCRLVANLPASGDVYVAYSKINDMLPNYDIDHFKKKIPTQLVNVRYGEQEVSLSKPLVETTLITNKKWLWIVMSVLILIIGYFAFSMLKKEQ